MKLTIQIKLLPTPEQKESLLDVMKIMNAAASYAAAEGFKNKVFGQISIHHLCYYRLREEFGLSSEMAVRAIGKVVDSFAMDKNKCPVFKPLGAVPLDKKLYRIVGLSKVSIRVLEDRIRIPIVIGDYFDNLLSKKMGQADLVYKGGKFYLYATIEYETPPPIKPKKWLGVDLGIVNLATDSKGEKFSGEKVTRNRRRRMTARKQYQRKGTKNAKRRLKKMSGKQAHYQCWVNHNISKKLVDKAKALRSGIALEDLKGIRSRIEATVSKRFRRTFGNWSFAQLRSFVEYKAVKEGIPVLFLDPKYSSQTCSKCGHREKDNRPSQDRFKCKQCGFSANADFNAALNLSAWAARSPAPKASA
jgi:putative transposase